MTKMKILGIWFGNGITLVEQDNCLPKLSKLENNLNLWKSRSLSLVGKSLIINVMGASKLWFLAKILTVPKLYSKLLKCKQPDPNLRYLYKKFRNKVVKDLKDSKSTCFNQYFSLNKYNMQKLWSGIRSVINIGKCKKKLHNFHSK